VFFFRWKSKVKKLEKGVDKYRNEASEVSSQYEQLNAYRNNFLMQIENRVQEISTLKDINSTLNEKLNIKEVEVGHF
jgi:chromosome segregation ATPase